MIAEEEVVLYALGGDPKPGMVFKRRHQRRDTTDLSFEVKRVHEGFVWFRFEWPSHTFYEDNNTTVWPIAQVRELLVLHTSVEGEGGSSWR